MTQESVTGDVVNFIVGARYEAFPAEVVALSKRCIVDGLGVILAGSTAPVSDIQRRQIQAAGCTEQATVFGRSPFRTNAASAALANATSGHALDWDDTQLSTTPDRIYGLMTHPTIPPLAASLALGERLHASGKALLEAFITGFEVECKIAEAINPRHYVNGFHSSGTVGTFGAAAAAARLLGLDKEQVANALGIAASLCGGIRVNFGTMTKPLHVGKAAEQGIVAAELAALGFTAGADALDGPWGFFQVFGGGADLERIRGLLGKPFSIVSPGVSIKPYPCGVVGHQTMDAMLKLVTDNDVRPEAIQGIRLRAGSNILKPLRYARATSELEAKFCPAFMLASIAIRRKAGLQEFSDEFVRSAPVQRMMERVETVLDPHIEAQGFDKIRSIVEVTLSDGRLLRQASDDRYRGGPSRPFSWQELRGKFIDCGELVLPLAQLDVLLGRLEHLEQSDDVAELARELTAGAVAEVGSARA
jgi:2-methylcitrate dehydratase PrpD